MTVKLHTFETSASKKKSTIKRSSPKAETSLLQRVSQVIAAGGEIELRELVGEHECTDISSSPFDKNRSLRQGNKSTLVEIAMNEVGVKRVSDLPSDGKDCAVIVDAMHAIHRWSFRPGEIFGEVQCRYLHNIITDVLFNTSSIHFCCDRYDHTPSLKSLEREMTIQGTSKEA